MDTSRQHHIDRLSSYRVQIDNPYYLHFRTLFRDLEKASLHARGSLLDIGCGNKPYEQMFAGRVVKYTGCDIVQSSKNCVDIICPATLLPVPDEIYETVLSTQVIEHVADHRAMLKEAFRVLQPGGILILSGPMYWPLHEEPYDFFRFTEHGLRYLLENIGFSVENITQNGGKWALCGQVIVHTIQNTRLNFRLVVKLLNRLFAYLDDHAFNGANPMNYVVIARKQ